VVWCKRPEELTDVSIAVGVKFILQKAEILVIATLAQIMSYTVSYNRRLRRFGKTCCPPPLLFQMNFGINFAYHTLQKTCPSSVAGYALCGPETNKEIWEIKIDQKH
jgi:hypothetical protein